MIENPPLIQIKKSKRPIAVKVNVIMKNGNRIGTNIPRGRSTIDATAE